MECFHYTTYACAPHSFRLRVGVAKKGSYLVDIQFIAEIN